jgi:hypothetical protein
MIREEEGIAVIVYHYNEICLNFTLLKIDGKCFLYVKLMRLQFGLFLFIAIAIPALQFVCGVFADVAHEIGQLAASVVAYWLVVAILWQPKESGEATYIKT